MPEACTAENADSGSRAVTGGRIPVSVHAVIFRARGDDSDVKKDRNSSLLLDFNLTREHADADAFFLFDWSGIIHSISAGCLILKTENISKKAA